MGPLGKVLRRTLLKLGSSGGPQGDADLLERFAARGDQAAFEEMVRRHGPMVLRVCQRVLRHPQDTEDAFQATFVVLARKAGAIAKRELLGGWLHGVAHRVALKARAKRYRQEQKPLLVEPAVAASTQTRAAEDWHSVLDQEVSRLPEKYRLPVILCYLEGKTSEEAAGQLHCAPGTVRSQLSRACDMLRPRLARRGVALSAAALAHLLTQEASRAAVPASLAAAAARNGLLASGNGAIPAGAVSASASSLAEAVLREMARSRLQTVALTVLAVVGLLGGIGWLTVSRFAGSADPVLAAPGIPLGNHPGGSKLLFADGGKKLVSLGNDQTVKVWDVAARRELAAFHLPGMFLALSPDGRMLAASAGDGSVRLFHGRTGKEVAVLAGLDRANSAAFSPDGRALAVAGNGPLRLFDTATGRELPVRCDVPAGLAVLQVNHFAVAWSPDGKTLAVIQRILDAKSIRYSFPEAREEFWRDSLSARLVMLDAGTGKQRAVFADLVPSQSLLAFSPDSRWLAAKGVGYGYLPGPLRMIDVATGREHRQFATDGPTGHDSIGFRPDSKTLFKVDYHGFSERAGRLVFFDMESGKEQTALRVPLRYGPSGIRGASVATTVVTISPDGKMVAVGQKEGEIGLLELK
jgi:RNA polymerase sigma factor (sigma-70 family)